VRSNGRVIGRVTPSSEDDAGYIQLMRRFTGADVLLRTPAGPVPASTLSPRRTNQAFSFHRSGVPLGPAAHLAAQPAGRRMSLPTRQGAQP
jgi:hypothetical protein